MGKRAETLSLPSLAKHSSCNRAISPCSESRADRFLPCVACVATVGGFWLLVAGSGLDHRLFVALLQSSSSLILLRPSHSSGNCLCRLPSETIAVTGCVDSPFPLPRVCRSVCEQCVCVCA